MIIFRTTFTNRLKEKAHHTVFPSSCVPTLLAQCLCTTVRVSTCFTKQQAVFCEAQTHSRAGSHLDNSSTCRNKETDYVVTTTQLLLLSSAAKR